ncbi:TetR/AcrR family transcriptional regulator [Woeseia oceani]|uniref:HTH tetR-type domain-containing protein n=1 Tax=Woeseia oceani TaxID=1548547 RepID=A0A193LFQ0_9GAMM|nr:TetR/AcrR family transcriptional regulator [Woeseia oceani]ANO51360.1 hypothetical protein BA177_09250 [Woeseia oceani]
MDTASQPIRRRSQEERRTTTQTALLEATVRCLGRLGFAGTSISSVIKEARVSRGALLHHYPAKNELIAHAIHHFYCQRLDRFKAKLLGANTDQLSLEDRLRVLKDDFATWYDTAREIEVAMRTNQEIASLQEQLSAQQHEQMSCEYEQLLPEFAVLENPRDMIGIACYLMRGLASDRDQGNVARRFDACVAMIQGYLDRAH